MHLVPNMIRRFISGATGVLLAIFPVFGTVYASSPDAWKEFQQKVEVACLKAAQRALDVKVIQVDPYGSDSYGFAVMLGTEPGGSDAQRLIACAYDKRAEVAEISGPFH